MTVIGAVTPGGFKAMNMTTYEYVNNGTEPELLLTNVGPVLLDPTQQSVSDARLVSGGMNIISNYLNHWVEAVVVTGQGSEQLFSGVVVMINDEFYLLHISRDNDPSYIVGPLMGSNAYVIHDYGIGQYGCEALYSFPWKWFVNEPPSNTTCPAPPPGPVTTLLYQGYWPELSIILINTTAIKIEVTFKEGTRFSAMPQYFTLSFLDQGSARWLSPTCVGAGEYRGCSFTMGAMYSTLQQNLNYSIVVNFGREAPRNYYLIMTITYVDGLPNEWFVWNITNYSVVNYPMWLDAGGPPANVLYDG